MSVELTEQKDSNSQILPTVEVIPERDVTAIKDPTNIWQLTTNDQKEHKLYEQWEKMRRFRVKAIYTSPYGESFYLKNADDPFGVRVEDTDTPKDSFDEMNLAPERPGRRHHVALDETVYSIARQYKISPTTLMDHNEITDANSVQVGSWIYIPKPQQKERPAIEYRILENPRPMHVSLLNGTTKWRFGNVRVWADIRAEAKHYAEGQNIDVLAVAKVPVEDTIAAYYMDRHDIGKYTETGRPAYTRGFSWQHLAEGHIQPEVKKPDITARAVADAMLEDKRPALPEHLIVTPEPITSPPEPPEPKEEVVPVPEPIAVPEDYKATFRYLNIEESPECFKLLQDMDIREMDGTAPPIHRKADSAVMVSGWFTHQGTPYYRVATRHWYAIPTHLAYSVEDEPFNGLSVDLPTRVANNLALSSEERRMVMFAKAAAKYNKIRTISGLLRRK